MGNLVHTLASSPPTQLPTSNVLRDSESLNTAGIKQFSHVLASIKKTKTNKAELWSLARANTDVVVSRCNEHVGTFHHLISAEILNKNWKKGKRISPESFSLHVVNESHRFLAKLDLIYVLRCKAEPSRSHSWSLLCSKHLWWWFIDDKSLNVPLLRMFGIRGGSHRLCYYPFFHLLSQTESALKRNIATEERITIFIIEAAIKMFI